MMDFDIKYLVGNKELLETIHKVPARTLFDEEIVGFLGAVSKRLMKNPVTKVYSDVTAYAFWIRKQSLVKEGERFAHKKKYGRGVAFHIAPSNVAVNFAVSFTSALLAGNACVVRVSNKEFPQVDMICDAIRQVMEEEFQEMQKYLVIVRYEHDQRISDYLSSICDIRIVWGGNRTLAEIRRSPLPPRAIEMAFPDRHSLAVIDADAYMSEDAVRVAELFYIDTYFTDQNACSSPRLVVWVGDRKEEAALRFYSALHDKLEKEYELAPILAVDKLNIFLEYAAEHTGVRKLTKDNLMVRVKLEGLTDDLMDYKMGGGYFFEYWTDNLEEMIPVLSKECQTISYLGVDPEQIRSIVEKSGVRGVDRIVKLGHTMDLSFYWDGYDMIDTMSRYIQVL